MKNVPENKWKQFFMHNKEEFDPLVPRPSTWKRIDQSLFGNSRSSVWWKAAAILFFVLSIGLLVDKFSASPQAQLVSHQQVVKEFGLVENYYSRLISEKEELIDSFRKKSGDDEGLEHDLKKLDAMYEVLKEELGRNPSKKVTDALILNLLVRIDLLNQQLEFLEALEASPTPEGEEGARI
jgi:hypothetical protein